MLPLGNTQGLGQVDGSLYDEDSFLNGSIVIPNVHLKASVRKQNSCAETKSKCIYINNWNGFWRNKTNFIDFHQRIQKSFINRPRNLTTLLIFGDSVGKYFYESIIKTSICSTLFKKCKLTYTWAYVKFKYFNYTEEERYDNKDFNESLFLRGVSESILLDRDMRSKNSGVVFNFGLHMVRSLSMERSMKLFEKFLNTLKDIQTILKQDAPQVIWKTTSSPIAPISKNRQCRFISLTVSF